MTVDRDTNKTSDLDSDSQMLRCVECGQFFPASDRSDELVPVGTAADGQCTDCGGDKFEQVVFIPGGD